MTRDDCLYIWDVVENTLSNPENYKTQKDSDTKHG